jgi:membrane-associated phospholipid phosphatase
MGGTDSAVGNLISAAQIHKWPGDFIAPLETIRENPVKLALPAGMFLGLWAVDPQARDLLGGRIKSGAGGSLVDGVNDLGSKITVSLLISGAGAFAYFDGRPYLLETSFLALESVLFSTFWTEMGKLLTGRERPEATAGGRGALHGPNLFQPENRKSLPSGHATAAFAAGAVVARRYPGRPALAAYGLAGGVALARVIKERHWGSDVFLGSLIGWTVANAIIDNRSEPSGGSGEDSNAWILRFGPGSISLSRDF